jgi:hypothetical protein
MPGPERELVLAIVKAVAAHWPDAWVFKVMGHPGQQVGVPDLLVCVDGRLTGLEVKARRGTESVDAARRRVTLTQRAQLDKLHRAGAAAAVVVSVEEALAAVAGQPGTTGAVNHAHSRNNSSSSTVTAASATAQPNASASS